VRSPGAAVLLSAVAVLGLASCTVGEEEPTGGGTSPSPSGTSLPDDREAVTDGLRPTATDVVLSFAVWEDSSQTVEASGYVSPVVEDGGTCTLELTAGSVTRSVDVPAIADATTTVCPGLAVPGDELSPGVWTLRLRYSSATTEGTSEPLDVEVPA
jgi:hypothetical protein